MPEHYPETHLWDHVWHMGGMELWWALGIAIFVGALLLLGFAFYDRKGSKQGSNKRI